MPDPLQAVLFDLDGTLLANDLDVFLPQYFRRLSAKMSGMFEPRSFVAHLLAATQVMQANDGRASNEDVFAEAFYPLLGRERAELEPMFFDFYRHDFPALQEFTRCRPEARAVVKAAFDLGCDVVIATDPLFPAVAIEQRLAWAGVDGFPYRLVTTYENSRACKPSPLYYRQILETIGRPASACLMAGNEPRDMAAAAVGCRTYLVTDGSAPVGGVHAIDGDYVPTCQGTLVELGEMLVRGRVARGVRAG